MFGHSMQAGADNVHTRKIAEFVSTLSYDRIPGEVRERIKLLILDALGCGLYGAQLEWCRILQSTLKALDSTRTTSVWGTPLRLSSPHAALVNGTFVDQFTPAAVDNPRRIALARKVEVIHDPTITALGSAFRAQGQGRDLLPRRAALSHNQERCVISLRRKKSGRKACDFVGIRTNSSV